MKCPFCNVEVSVWDQTKKAHLIVTKNSKDSHFHTHGDFNNKEVMKELIDAANMEAGINKNIDKLDRKEIVLHNRQRIGDILMFTCAIRDLKSAYPDLRINVVSTAAHIWDYNPYIDRTLAVTEQNTLKIGPGKGTNQSNRIDWHFANAYRLSIEDALNIHIPQGESRPDIWFTEEEYNAKRVFEKPYWIIIIGGEKGWGCKMYPFNKWQNFVDQNKDTLFVQLGAIGDRPERLKGVNVIDYVGKTENKNTGIRDLFKLFLNAEGSIGLVSFHMHLSAALYKPAIVIAGAREPVHFTRYEGHRYLSTDGCLPCSAITACWHCDINTCIDLVVRNTEKIPKCVDMIEPEDITKALNDYYIGGRLKKGVVSEKPKLKNIVDTPVKVITIEKPISDVKVKYGLSFGGGYLTEEDWKFIKSTIEENNIKSVVEFRASLSTLLLNELDLKVVTYEINQTDIDRIKLLNNKCDIRLWDNRKIDNIEKFDLVFVNGPAGGKNREFSTKIASEISDIVIIHDATREYEMKWQEKYFKERFLGPGGGGNRCHLWSKNKDTKIIYRTGSSLMSDNILSKTENLECEHKSSLKNDVALSINEIEQKNNSQSSNMMFYNDSKKFIKLVSTARGWGGAQRSVTTIMKMLLKEGHKVEFIPFRNQVSSREFQQYIKENLQDLIVTENYSTIKEKCDILFIYADDFCWELDKPEICDIFLNINVNKKIMMLNYRRGKIGEIEWTKKFDKFMFLNSTQEKELLKVLPNVKTKVLAPCTELEEFLKVEPNYNNNIRIVRHSSQGDAKFPKNFKEELDAILDSRKDLEVYLLPGPSFINSNDRIKKYHRTADKKVIADFLSKGNLFVYSLPNEPEKYLDMGPRVILEAMASGLSVIADNWGGALDRINSDTGWLCSNKKDFVEIIKNVTFEELEKKGKAARKRAIEEFVSENWVKEILE